MAKIVDRADWSGIEIRSIDVGARNKGKKILAFGGINYASKGEVTLARLLTKQKILFTPNVPLFLEDVNGKPNNYVPDFILNGIPYLWKGAELIHGFEAKGKGFSPLAIARVEALRRERNIFIKLVSDQMILDIAEDGGLLPLVRLDDE
ncbi:MAG: hypothetical protein AAB692_04625 [Patescibacteria group bacterium]